LPPPQDLQIKESLKNQVYSFDEIQIFLICKPTRAAASIFNKLESRNQQTKTVSACWKDIRGTDLGDDCIGRILKCKRQNPTHNTVTNFIIKEVWNPNIWSTGVWVDSKKPLK